MFKLIDDFTKTVTPAGVMRDTRDNDWHVDSVTLTETGTKYLRVRADRVEVTMEPRPGYCDRGNWVVKVTPVHGAFADIGPEDGFPRYYFDFDNMMEEMLAWLERRGYEPADREDLTTQSDL